MSGIKGFPKNPKKISASMANLTLDLDCSTYFANTLPELVGAALAICEKAPGFALDAIEAAVAKASKVRHDVHVDSLAIQVAKGDDVLGREYCRIKSAQDRRIHGPPSHPKPLLNRCSIGHALTLIRH